MVDVDGAFRLVVSGFALHLIIAAVFVVTRSGQGLFLLAMRFTVPLVGS